MQIKVVIIESANVIPMGNDLLMLNFLNKLVKHSTILCLNIFINIHKFW